MQEKIKVVHFHNGTGGGVLSVIKNLSQYSKNEKIENCVIYIINKEKTSNFIFSKTPGAVTEHVFYYSPKWNFYYTCRQLSKLLPDNNFVIVAHDWLELGMASNLGLPIRVIFFLHGNYDYYFKLAEKHSAVIDNFICISKPIYHNLVNYLPERRKDILLRYFPVPTVQVSTRKSVNLNIFYCVRSLLDERKQFLLLPQIDHFLKKAGVIVNWTVVGWGGEEHPVKQGLQSLQNLTYYPQLENEEVLKQLELQDVFVLPSYNEGLPVALVEAMKAGLVPLISNWENATDELVVTGESGVYIKIGDAEGYAKAIMELNDNRGLLDKMSEQAVGKANQYFDPSKNTTAIEDIILDLGARKIKTKRPEKSYGSRLDHPFLPNNLVTVLRKFFQTD